jgi:nucleoside-diphosphate-sugar epimerase
MTDVARELGWRSIRIPKAAIDVTVEVLQRLPLASTRAEWLHTLRTPVVMSIDKARRVLGWDPRYDALDTLRETVAGAREARLLPGG